MRRAEALVIKALPIFTFDKFTQCSAAPSCAPFDIVFPGAGENAQWLFSDSSALKDASKDEVHHALQLFGPGHVNVVLAGDPVEIVLGHDGPVEP